MDVYKIKTILKYRCFTLFISAVIFALPFWFPELNLLSFIGMIPLYLIFFDLAEEKKNEKLFRLTFFFSMIFYLCIFIWFWWFYPLDFAGLSNLQSIIVAGAAWIGFPLMQTAVFLLIPLSVKLFRDINNYFKPLLYASVYVLMEWVQSWFMTGLTWAKLSISQYKDLYMIQSVSLFGTYTTSFIIIFINVCFALFLYNKYTKDEVECKKNNTLIIYALLVFFVNQYYGMFKTETFVKPEKTLRVSVIQGNISSFEKWEDNGVDRALEVYDELTSDAVREYSPEICVWTETAIPAGVYSGSGLYNIFNELAKKYNSTLFTGCFYEDIEKDETFNSIMAFDIGNKGDEIKVYNKRHLVPFGEYLPLENILKKLVPFVADMAMFSDTIEWGKGENLIEINKIKYGGLVCFDSIFPELARLSTKKGAELLLLVTNDSWYRDSIGIYQHNAQAVLRAVENGRYLVRSANTGISSIIAPTGEILQQSKVDTRVALNGEVGISTNLTVYTVFGDVILYFSVLVILFCIYLKIKNKLKEKKYDLQKNTII